MTTVQKPPASSFFVPGTFFNQLLSATSSSSISLQPSKNGFSTPPPSQPSAFASLFNSQSSFSTPAPISDLTPAPIFPLTPPPLVATAQATARLAVLPAAEQTCGLKSLPLIDHPQDNPVSLSSSAIPPTTSNASPLSVLSLLSLSNKSLCGITTPPPTPVSTPIPSPALIDTGSLTPEPSPSLQLTTSTPITDLDPSPTPSLDLPLIDSALDSIAEDFAPSVLPPLYSQITQVPLRQINLQPNQTTNSSLPNLTELLTSVDTNLSTNSPQIIPSSNVTVRPLALQNEQILSTSPQNSLPVDAATTAQALAALTLTDSSSTILSPTSISQPFLANLKGYAFLAASLLVLNTSGFLLLSHLVPTATADSHPVVSPLAGDFSTPTKVLNFQGQVTNKQNIPVSGTKSIQFTLYNSDGLSSDPVDATIPDPLTPPLSTSTTAPTLLASQQLWNSTYCDVWVNEKGFFNVNLGAGLGQNSDHNNCGPALPADIFTNNPNVWIQISIDRETLAPRQALKLLPADANPAPIASEPPSPTPLSIQTQSLQFYFQPGYGDS